MKRGNAVTLSQWSVKSFIVSSPHKHRKDVWKLLRLIVTYI